MPSNSAGQARLTDAEIAAKLETLMAAHREVLEGGHGAVERARATLRRLGWVPSDAADLENAQDDRGSDGGGDGGGGSD